MKLQLQTPISPYTVPGIRPYDRASIKRRIINGSQSQRKRLPELLAIVLEHFNITKDEFLEKNRTYERVLARKFFTLMARDYLKLPLVLIGKFLDRDHTTVIHLNRTLRNEMEFDSNLRIEYQSLAAKLFN